MSDCLHAPNIKNTYLQPTCFFPTSTSKHINTLRTSQVGTWETSIMNVQLHITCTHKYNWITTLQSNLYLGGISNPWVFPVVSCSTTASFKQMIQAPGPGGDRLLKGSSRRLTCSCRPGWNASRLSHWAPPAYISSEWHNSLQVCLQYERQ